MTEFELGPITSILDDHDGLGRTLPRRPAAIGRYRVLGVLGAGGMGTAYRAIDPRSGRIVAVKTAESEGYTSASRCEEGLREEYAALGHVQSPYVVKPIEGVFEGPLSYFSMEFVEGETLFRRLRCGTLSLAAIGRHLLPLLRGLGAVHMAGYVHRDVKPDNVVLSGDGRSVLIDFGLARRRGGPIASPMLEGTPQYMSPEEILAEGDVDARSDLFSFGCILYEALVGCCPFTGEDADAELDSVLFDRPLPPSRVRTSIPDGLEDLALSLLEKDRLRRPASAREVEVRLSRALGRAAGDARAA